MEQLALPRISSQRARAQSNRTHSCHSTDCNLPPKLLPAVAIELPSACPACVSPKALALALVPVRWVLGDT